MKSITLTFPTEGVELTDKQIKSVLFASLACYAEAGAGGKKRRAAATAMYKVVDEARIETFPQGE